MEAKYSNINVQKALAKWIGAEVPEENSIYSRIFDSHSPTSMFLYKKYPLYGYRILPSHVFIVIDGQVWHPGASHTKIFEPTEDRDSYISSLEELCYSCSYKRLISLFERDKSFNIMTNNCQNIMGSFLDTILLWATFGLLVLYVIVGRVYFLIASILIMSFVVLRERLSSSIDHIKYLKCPHIKTIIRKL